MHNCMYWTYDSNTPKTEIFGEINEYVSHETYFEGGSGIKRIRWYDEIIRSYDEAMSFVISHDKGWYDNLAVRYRAVEELQVSSKKLEVLQGF